MSQLFVSGGQSIGASASVSVLSMNIQGWFPLGLTGLISLLPKGLSRVFSRKNWKHHFFSAQPSLWSNSHWFMTIGRIIVWTIWPLVGDVMSLLFNMLSRFVTAFFPRSKLLSELWEKLYIYIHTYIHIYIFAAPGLTCGTWDCWSSFWHAGSSFLTGFKPGPPVCIGSRDS